MNASEINAAVVAGKLAQMHTSLTRGYVSRRGGAQVKPYAGRFGKGYRVLTPNWDSTRYCNVTYYVEA